MTKLRQEADEKNRYLMQKAEKILADLESFLKKRIRRIGLTPKIIQEDLIEGKGAAYLKEPDFVPFIDAISKVWKRFEAGPLQKKQVEAAKRLFLLFKDRVKVSELTCKFMSDYRDEYVRVSRSLEGGRKNQREIFEKIFLEYRLRYKEVEESSKFYWTVFWQAANVSPKIGKPGEREDNPEFLRLSDAITIFQAEKFGIRPEGLRSLLRVRGADTKLHLLPPAARKIEAMINQAA